MGTRWPMYLAAVLAANGLGAILIYVFLRYGLPLPQSTAIIEDRRRNLITFVTICLLFGFFSLLGAFILLRPVLQWELRGGPPSRREQLAALHAPLRQAALQLVLWIIGGSVFAALTITATPELTAAVILTTIMGATIVFGFTYMLGERLLRPVAARALSEVRFDKTFTPGIGTRMGMTWGLGTLAPTLGIVMLCVTQITTTLEFTARSLAIAILAIALLVILQAFALSMLTSSSISDPIQQVIQAMEKVESGEENVEVQVFDGSEVGQLQVGFNRMMAESAERRVLQELFGQHVGEDVARRAMEFGTELGGETRFVAVLFVDMVGSTSTAAERPPSEVVALLNDFFNIVVDVVDRHNGFVNKFVGDAALAIFGAPLNSPDAPTEALSAARELRIRLRSLAGFDFGIGVSAGLAVAGNIGSANRFEYTVIGDPVNEASRLQELAKTEPTKVVASGSALYFASDEEQANWELGEEVVLRGRKRRTRLATPINTDLEFDPPQLSQTGE
ncbi:adenylate/guanylate cyclase domain-containing protein [Smaragdicoccus niigatensis]|nr:adenylate/guanylate cyclase domain-containing protein [Smaragdicoccus niigatensis]